MSATGDSVAGFGRGAAACGGTTACNGADSLETPCKINLYLGVHHGRDVRGYHRVDSLMVPVALFDTVSVSDATSASDSASVASARDSRAALGTQSLPQGFYLEVHHSPAIEVPAEKSNVWRAAALLAQELGVTDCVRVDVRTRIPERAGLGGSSADAGATLRLLARRWGVDADDGRVARVARHVGADVPFFLRPQPGLFLGAGDVHERDLPPVEMPLALVMPAETGASTPEAYAEFDRSGEESVGYAAACAALASGDVRAVAANLYNNLEPAAETLCPEVARVVAWLRGQVGVLGAQVTGSGACSFAICESERAAADVCAAARERGWRAWSTKTLV